MVKLSTAGILFYEPDFIFATKLRQVWEREKEVSEIRIKITMMIRINKLVIWVSNPIPYKMHRQLDFLCKVQFHKNQLSDKE